MKLSISICTFVLSALLLTTLNAGTFNPDRYKQAEKNILKASPETYKNKRIFWQGTYIRMFTDFPRYMQKSGLKTSKDIVLTISPMNVPLVMKKKEFLDIISTLKRNTVVKAFGKVKKFRHTSKAGFPSYYLDCEHFEIVEEPKQKAVSNDNERPRSFKRRFKRDTRRRRRQMKFLDENIVEEEKAGVPKPPAN